MKITESMRIPVIGLVTFGTLVVVITGEWETIAHNIFPNTTWGAYSRDFFEHILAEAHGALLDLLVVGVVLFWFEQRHNARAEAKSLQQALVDLRWHRGPEAAYLTLGTVKKLLSLGENNLKLSELNFAELQIQDLQLVGANLHAAILRNSTLSRVKLDRCNCEAAIFVGAKFDHVNLNACDLRRGKFQDAILKGVDFEGCRMEVSSFVNANLRSASFCNVDCRGIDFRNADLRSANFVGAKHLTAEMLKAAKNIKYLKSDNEAIKLLVAAASKK